MTQALLQAAIDSADTSDIATLLSADKRLKRAQFGPANLSPLQYAMSIGQPKVVSDLISNHGFKDSETDTNGIRANDWLDHSQLLADAIERDELNAVVALIQTNPGLANLRFDPNDAPPLHFAVELGKDKLVKALIERAGLDPDQRAPNGDTPLHFAAKGKTSSIPGVSVDPGDAVAELLAQGADLTLANDLGRTAVHAVAFTGKAASLEKMARDPNFAAANVADDMGWSPMEVATAAGQTGIETYMVENGHAADDLLVPLDTTGLTTVDILVRATKIMPRIEDDEDLNAALLRSQGEVRDYFEELYTRPEFRPMLDIAAANAMGRRTGDPKATRIFMNFDSDACGEMTGKGGHGAFDPDSKTLAMGCARGRDILTGTIIHEMTHHAADAVFHNNAIPFEAEDSEEARAYLDAIEADVMNAHLFVSGDEAEVSRTFSERIATYTARGGNQLKKRNAALQEFIVGIPQAIQTHGPGIVDKVAPNSKALFEGAFAEACSDQIEWHDRFNEVASGNAAYVAGLPPVPPAVVPPAAWLSKTGHPPDKSLTERSQLSEMILAQYRKEHGAANTDTNEGKGFGLVVGDSAPLVHSAQVCRIPEDGDGTIIGDEALYALRRNINANLEDLSKDLPAEMSEDRMKDFLERASGVCHAVDVTTPLIALKQQRDALEAAAATREERNRLKAETKELMAQAGKDATDYATRTIASEMRHTVREARFEYVQRAKDKHLSPQQIAEATADAIMYDAACITLDSSLDQGRDATVLQTASPSFDDSKMAKIKAEMVRTLLASDDFDAVTGDIDSMKALSTRMASEDAGAMMTKEHSRWKNKVLKQNSGHVSVNVKSSKRAWVAALALV